MRVNAAGRATSGIYPRALAASGAVNSTRNFDETPGPENQGRVQGIDGDLTAMTCGRIGPDEMTDPASDIRYHGGSGGR